MSEAQEPLALELREVDKRVRDGSRMRTVLQGVSMQLTAGEVALLLGPSGSGKSTLLALAGLLSAPSRGEVLIDGEATSRLRDSFRAQVRRERVGFVFQHAELFDERSALDNVLLPAVPLGLDARHRRRADELLSRFGLAALTNTRTSQLSGGERARVALCRALLFAPKLLLCDEPTAHLDPVQSALFVEQLAECSAEGTAVLVATHDERVVRALADATVWEVLPAPESAVRRRRLG